MRASRPSRARIGPVSIPSALRVAPDAIRVRRPPQTLLRTPSVPLANHMAWFDHRMRAADCLSCSPSMSPIRIALVTVVARRTRAQPRCPVALRHIARPR
jgi:hypothetical protein